MSRFSRSRGASAVEYAALIAFAAVIFGGLTALGLQTEVGKKTSTAICRILHQDGCGEPKRPSPSSTANAQRAHPGGWQPRPDDGGGSPKPRPKKKDDGCHGFGGCLWSGVKQGAKHTGSAVKNVGKAAYDLGKGVVDLALHPGSIVDAGKYVWNHPLDAGRALIWDDDSSKMWKHHDYGGAVGRTLFNGASLVVAPSKLGKVGKLGKLGRRGKAARGGRAAEHAKPKPKPKPPKPPNPGFRNSGGWRAFKGKVFRGSPKVGEIAQGGIGNCWCLASMGAVAKQAPGLIKQMIKKNADGTFTVTFGDGRRVTVSADLPVNGARVGKSGWPAILEKAFAERYGTYDRLRGWPDDAMEMLTGKAAKAHRAQKPSIGEIAKGFRRRRAYAVSFPKDLAIPNAAERGIVGNHAYAVIGVNKLKGTLKLANPWGKSAKTVTLSMRELKDAGITLSESATR